MKQLLVVQCIVVAVSLLRFASGLVSGQTTREAPSPCVAASNASGSVEPRIAPRDDGPRRPDFIQFRLQLQDIVARKDEDGLLKAVHPDIRVGFDGAGDRDAFREHYLRNADEDFWHEFGSILSLGGKFRSPDDFDAPYTFSDWPEVLDPFECLVVIASRVRVREIPSLAGPVLAVVDFAVVQRLANEARVAGWERVQLADRRVGFIASRYLRSPIDHRALFQFQNGRWWLVAYLAGD